MADPDPRFEVPPEYADVYEKAFRSASRGEHGGDDDAGGDGRTTGRSGWWARHGWGVAAGLLVVLAVAIAAYALGRSTGTRPAVPPSAPTASYVTVSPIRPQLASSTCQPPTVSDAEGRTVSFVPGNALDADQATSWACSSSAQGAELVLTLPPGSTVVRVGLLPTRSLSGVTLNRIDSVDWIFSSGATVHQDLERSDASVAQIIDVAPSRGRTVRLRLSAVTSGAADLTAISSVYLWGPPDTKTNEKPAG